MDNLERTLLCWQAARLIEKNDSDMSYLRYGSSYGSDYRYCDKIQELSLAGFASYYLEKCWDSVLVMNTADLMVYKQLLEIDAKLGITQSEQLFACLSETFRIDLIEV